MLNVEHGAGQRAVPQHRQEALRRADGGGRLAAAVRLGPRGLRAEAATAIPRRGGHGPVERASDAAVTTRRAYGPGIRRLGRGFVRRRRGDQAHRGAVVHPAPDDGDHGACSPRSTPAATIGRHRRSPPARREGSAADRDPGRAARRRGRPPVCRRPGRHRRPRHPAMAGRGEAARGPLARRGDRPDRRHPGEVHRRSRSPSASRPTTAATSSARRSSSASCPRCAPPTPARGGSPDGRSWPSPGDRGWSRGSASSCSGWSTCLA